MAKTSMIARQKKRQNLVNRHAERRKALKAIISSPSSAPEEVQAAVYELSTMPRDASPTRLRKRCVLTGRSRGNLSFFGLSRNQFRKLAHDGQIPGVVKSSW